MKDRDKNASRFFTKVKEPMFRSSVIHTERRAIFKPYILSSSKETALTFERLTAYHKDPGIICYIKIDDKFVTRIYGGHINVQKRLQFFITFTLILYTKSPHY
jgi:hypothetical protein